MGGAAIILKNLRGAAQKLYEQATALGRREDGEVGPPPPTVGNTYLFVLEGDLYLLNDLDQLYRVPLVPVPRNRRALRAPHRPAPAVPVIDPTHRRIAVEAFKLADGACPGSTGGVEPSEEDIVEILRRAGVP